VRIILDADFSFAGVTEATFNSSLGHRLKVLREAFGLSQRELAKRAGVTNSNISMIEQGQVSPSIQSLHKILDAFPMTLAEFFSCNLIPDQTPVVRARDIAANARTSAEGVLIYQLSQAGLIKQISLSRQYFPNKSQVAMKTADQDIAAWVISGELDLHLATRVFKVEKGDGFYIKREQIYSFANPYAEIAEVVLASMVSNQ
jgi:transcriptional regulator with XRE-family HTH domain